MPQVAGTPWLSMYFETGGRLNYVNQQVLTSIGVPAQKLEQAAIFNVARTPASWAPQNVGGRTVLTCVDQPHACERILVPEFLEQARLALRAQALCASIPQRGMLLVAALGDFEMLMQLGRHYFDNAANPRVSPWVFAIQGGAITGRFFEENGQVGLDAVVFPAVAANSPDGVPAPVGAPETGNLRAVQSVDFDALARRASSAGATIDDKNALWGRALHLKEWLFIARGAFPDVRPYIAANPTVGTGGPMLKAFTDADKLERFARANGLLGRGGEVLFFSVPVAEAFAYVQQFEAAGVVGIHFNADSGSHGFFAPLAQLPIIKRFLGEQDSNGG